MRCMTRPSPASWLHLGWRSLPSRRSNWRTGWPKSFIDPREDRMKPADRERLRVILNSLDEVGLVALANKGLVRRAAKDFASITMQVEETEVALIVRGPDFTVAMPPDGPAKAKDDTKASGVTRQ